jgi:hypothetical protein
LRLHLAQRRPHIFEGRQCRLLLVQAQRFLPLLPRLTPCVQQVIVQPTAFLHLLLEEPLLALVRVQAIFEHLTNMCSMRLKQASCQGEHSSPA